MQRANRKFFVERHNASNITFRRVFLENNMTASLSYLDKAQSFEGADRGLSRDPTQSRHTMPQK
jgi:hypothetical protein